MSNTYPKTDTLTSFRNFVAELLRLCPDFPLEKLHAAACAAREGQAPTGHIARMLAEATVKKACGLMPPLPPLNLVEDRTPEQKRDDGDA